MPLLMCFRYYGNLKFPLTYNGKSKSRPLLLSDWRYFDKSLQTCSMSSLLSNIWILSKPLNLIGCHGNHNAKFAKQSTKIISSEALRGMKMKFCSNAHNISFNKKCVFFFFFFFFFLPLLMCSRWYGNIRFPLTYNWKSESRPLLPSHFRYFDKTFTEIFLE